MPLPYLYPWAVSQGEIGPKSRATLIKDTEHAAAYAVLYAFDLIEHDGNDLRDLPLIDRKRRLARLIGRAKHGVKEAAPPGSSPDLTGSGFCCQCCQRDVRGDV